MARVRNASRRRLPGGSPAAAFNRPPAELDPASSRSHILNAAERLFARHGFDATTVKHIGSEAGANPALIYYYFGDKEGLHQAVINRFADELISRAKSAIAEAATPEDLIRGITATQSAMFSGHRDRARIIARELIDHDAAHATAFLNRLSAEVFQRLRGAIEEGQRAGRF